MSEWRRLTREEIAEAWAEQRARYPDRPPPQETRDQLKRKEITRKDWDWLSGKGPDTEDKF